MSVFPSRNTGCAEGTIYGLKWIYSDWAGRKVRADVYVWAAAKRQRVLFSKELDRLAK